MAHDEAIESWTFTPEQGVPLPVAPYAHATVVDRWVYATGQLPIDPRSGEIVGSTISEQTDQVLSNLANVLASVGAALDQCVMIRAYLAAMDDYELFNRAYEVWFPLRLPSRTCIGVTGLALGARVEIDAVAFISKPSNTE